MKTKFTNILREVEFLESERKRVAAEGPHFRIYHCFWKPGTVCEAGEAIWVIAWVYRGQEFSIPLSLAVRILFDFLAHHPRRALSGTQIHAAIRSDPFFLRHGFNAMPTGEMVRKITRSAVRQYIARLRHGLDLTFREANARIDASTVVVSQPTDGNEVLYKLRGRCEWIHKERPNNS